MARMTVGGGAHIQVLKSHSQDHTPGLTATVKMSVKVSETKMPPE